MNLQARQQQHGGIEKSLFFLIYIKTQTNPRFQESFVKGS